MEFDGGARAFETSVVVCDLANKYDLTDTDEPGVVAKASEKFTARAAELLREAGVKVIEGSFRYSDFERADEIFSTGNYSKLMPVVRIDDRSLQPGPFYRKARALYWDFAHSA